jgi:hypothetical protein
MSMVICRWIESSLFILGVRFVCYVGDYSCASKAKFYMISYIFLWCCGQLWGNYNVCCICCVLCWGITSSRYWILRLFLFYGSVSTLLGKLLFWNVTLWSLVVLHQCFGGTYCSIFIVEELSQRESNWFLIEGRSLWVVNKDDGTNKWQIHQELM